MIVKTEAIVLKSMKYRDTSKIVTFYSKEFGKIKGIAKGARAAKNTFGSSLEPMTCSFVVLYKKEHQELHLISQCDAIVTFKNILKDFNRMSVALGVIELLHILTHYEEKNEILYQQLMETLRAIDSSSKNPMIFLQAFTLRVAVILGYSPQLVLCGSCGKNLEFKKNQEHFAFHIARGAVLCSDCISQDGTSVQDKTSYKIIVPLSAPALQILHRFSVADIRKCDNLTYNRGIWNEIDELLRLYLQYHFDQMKNLKSIELLQNSLQ